MGVEEECSQSAVRRYALGMMDREEALEAACHILVCSECDALLNQILDSLMKPACGALGIHEMISFILEAKHPDVHDKVADHCKECAACRNALEEWRAARAKLHK